MNHHQRSEQARWAYVWFVLIVHAVSMLAIGATVLVIVITGKMPLMTDAMLPLGSAIAGGCGALWIAFRGGR